MVTRTEYLSQPGLHVAWLVVASGPRRGRDIQVRKTTNIGREAKNHVILDDETVSAEHARIRFENGAYVLYDQASSNGTMLNGERIQKAMLRDEDRITIGRLQLVFKETKID